MDTKNGGCIYLIPCTLGETPVVQVIPAYVKEIINNIDIFIVENTRSARRYLKLLDIQKDISLLVFHELDKQTESTNNFQDYLKVIEDGKNIGILSEVGYPCIADPGAEILKIAHQKNIKVIPLVGPSSILLSLAASGFNGQNFCFHGYLPKEQPERIKKIKELEQAVYKQKQTQIFIETPYRNNHIVEDLLNNCFPETLLCIAANLTLVEEFIKTKKIKDWKSNAPDINKQPVIFLLYK